jgi:uncharacterized membrane protein
MTTTVPPPGPRQLSEALTRNIQVLESRRAEEAADASLQDRIAAAITRFTGSMTFVYLHLAVYGGWVVLNLGLIPGMTPFDPSFVILASEASVEAIFLSTFVLISQNRMSAAADRRADLDLHIGLLAEHEVTKLAVVVDAIAKKLGVDAGGEEIEEIKRDVAPEAVMDEIEDRQRETSPTERDS